MAENDAFGRDLGYLDKFFDKLESHAANLPAEAGGRLRALMGEERQRWAEIRRLIGADGGAAAPGQNEAAATEAPAAPPPAAASATAPAPAAAAAPASAEEPERPYTRAYREGMRQLANLPPAPPPAAPHHVRTPTGNSRTTFTVGSLKRRR